MWLTIFKNSPFRRHVRACFWMVAIFSYVSGYYSKTIHLWTRSEWEIWSGKGCGQLYTHKWKLQQLRENLIVLKLHLFVFEIGDYVTYSLQHHPPLQPCSSVLPPVDFDLILLVGELTRHPPCLKKNMLHNLSTPKHQFPLV